MKQTVPEHFSIKQLSTIFHTSSKVTIRYLKCFDIPLQLQERKKSKIQSIQIKEFNPELYHSIYLALQNHIKKPFYTIRDLAPMFNKSHSGMYRWLKRNEMMMHTCGNKNIILASDLLNIGNNKDNLRHLKAKPT